MIGWAGPLLAVIAALAPTHNGGPGSAPARDARLTVTPPPATLLLLRPAARPTPAQRVVPGLH